MSVRVTTLSDTLVNAAGAAQPNIAVTITLVPPTGAGPLLDTNGEVIDTTPLTATTNALGVYSQAVIAPGDITPTGATYTVTYLQTTILSPSFAYSATPITPSSWVPGATTAGLIRMYLTLVEANATADQAAGIQIAISQDALWTGGVGAGQDINPRQPVALVTDGSGNIYCYMPPSSQLNPSTTYYTCALPSGQQLFFTVPTTYTGSDKGAWSSGTTYALNDIAEVSGVPYQSLQAGNLNHAPASSPTWWSLYIGEKITSHLTTPVPAGQMAIGAAGILHDANVPTLIDDPVQAPVTLDDDLHNLAVRTGMALRTLTSNTTLNAVTDDWIIGDATGGAVTLTLPAASARARAYFVIRKNGGGNTVTIQRAGADVINGANTFVLTQQYQWAILRSDTANGAWYVQTGSGSGTGTFTGEVTGTDFRATGLPGATAGTRLVGGNTTGAPTSGTFVLGDLSADFSGKLWICTTAGTPGTWTQLGGGGGLPSPLGTAYQEVLSDGTEGIWGSRSNVGGLVDPTTTDGDLLYRKKTTVNSAVIGGIGDSIMAGTTITTAPLVTAATGLSAGVVTVTASNQGISGTTSNDWVAGSANLIAAKAAFASAGVRVVLIMLGTNDSKTAVATSAATYRANLLGTCVDLLTAGYIPVLLYPPYLNTTSGSFDATSPGKVAGYCTQIDSLCDNAHIWQGDTLAQAYFKANTGALQGDGVHPTQTGSDYMANTLWVPTLRRLFDALTGTTWLQRLTLGSGLGISAGVLSVTSTGPAFAWATKTANYSMSASDSGIAANAASGAITITLPSAVGATNLYAVKKIDASSNQVTINTVSGQTIEGNPTQVLTLLGVALVFGSDGTNWRIEASHGRRTVPLTNDNAASPLIVFNSNGEVVTAVIQ